MEDSFDLILPTWRFIRPILLSYSILEIIFLAAFYHIFLPQCNRRQDQDEYRLCGRHRHKLMIRIMNRIERTCRVTGTPFLPTFSAFLKSFFPNVYTGNDDSNSSSSLSSSDDTTTVTTWPLRGDMDLLFAWAFFGKDPSELEIWEHTELHKMYGILHATHGIQFNPGQMSSSNLGSGPMRLCIDPLQPSYRPFLIYFMSWVVKSIGGVALRILGFRCYTSESGLVYWHRPRQRNTNMSILGSLIVGDDASLYQSPLLSSSAAGSNIHNEEKMLPLLFFHGIAPGGHTFYLPMILRGLGGDGRPIFIFENPSISFHVTFGTKPLSEKDTLSGIWEAVNLHLDPTTPLSIAAHSFGSCQVTWLLHYSVLAHRIKQVTLIDPVAMLLTEPDVMSNFVYARSVLNNKSALGKKIGAVANELFIEHYLRRHFSWYNSELWLEDIPQDTKVLICLSENDEILNFEKVKREVEIFCEDVGGSTHGVVPVTSKPKKHKSNASSTAPKTVDLITWENAGHAFCVSRPDVWKQLYSAMKVQERIITKEQACNKY